jgi:hypothetical protein
MPFTGAFEAVAALAFFRGAKDDHGAVIPPCSVCRTMLNNDATPVEPKRWKKAVLGLIVAVWSWLMMQAVHECGHALAAVLSGGRIAKVVLHPLAISRTDIEPNPHPLPVVWSGPLFGAFAPLALWWVLRRRTPIAVRWLLQVFAGFCLVANGGYLMTAFWDPAGDTADLLRLGCPVALVAGVGLTLLASGFAVWHGLGSGFGVRALPADAGDRLAWLLTVTTVVVAALEATFSARL